MLRSGGVFRQDEHDGLCGVNRMNDRTRIKLAWDHVTGCDPAPDAVGFKGLDDDIGNSRILRRVADEDGGRATAHLLVVPTFGHVQPPGHL
jgi:hypothetical protein